MKPTSTARGHDVDREGEVGRGGGTAGDIDFTALIQSGWGTLKKPRDDPANTHLMTSIRRLEPPSRATSSTTGVAEEGEPTPQASGEKSCRITA